MSQSGSNPPGPPSEQAAAGDSAVATGVAAGLRPLPALKERVRALIESWNELQSGEWNAMAALAQYEELERISSGAEQLRATEIADAVVEAAVYLCTFVEGRQYPSNSQRQRLNDLIERLAQAVSSRPVPRPRERQADVRTALYLRPQAHEMATLAPQLGRHRYVVRPCEQLAQALALADEATPDALLVHASMVNELSELIEHVEQARGEVKGHAVCVVLGEQIDSPRRLFAQRAGADLVLEGSDASAIAIRLDELLAQQRNLDYRVLIVEDDRSQAAFCEAVLRHRGIASRSCLDPFEALDAIAEFKPDLVLLDLYLPGMNGIEVAQLIRERPEYAFLPIVFLSGETDLDKRFDAIRMGGDDFLTKPVKPRHLVVEVETRIRRARQLPSRPEHAPRVERRGHLVSRSVFVEEVRRCVEAAESEGACVAWIGLAGEKQLDEELGLVACGALSQQIAAALAGTPELVHPVCAFGEWGFLTIAYGDGDTELRARLEQVQAMLEARKWLDADALVKVAVVVAGVRIAPGLASVDALVRRVRTLGESLQAGQDGSVAYEALRTPIADMAGDPVQRLARALLRGHLIPEAVRPEYQPLVPLTGELTGQYAVRFALTAPRATQRIEVPAARVREFAREAGAVVNTDRQCVRRALAALAERVARGDEVRLFLPVAIESALDPSFAPWLAAELQMRALAASSAGIELGVEEALADGGRLAAAVESMRLVGCRLCVSGLEGGEAHVRVVRQPGIAAVKLNAPSPASEGAAAAWGSERGRLVVEAAKHGKVVIANGVRDAREFAELLRLGVHYVQADVFAPWSSDANFDFAGTKV